MRKVIVTGGAGFIGSHTCVELINSGFQPVIVDDMRNSHERIIEGIEHITGETLRIHRIDCCDEKALDQVFRQEDGIYGMIHFAAYKSVNESVREPVKYYQNNIGSLVALLNVARQYEVRRLVFSSSCAVYGQAKTLPVKEDADATQANSPYGYTKIVCEQLLRDARSGDPSWNIVMLRYFNPVGAHPSGAIGELPIGVPTNLVPYVVQTAAGIRPALTIHGNDYDTPDGTCQRDFLHVVDLAKAHVSAIEHFSANATDACSTFNLGTGSASSVREVVDTFERVTGVTVPCHIGPRRAGDVPSIYADVSLSDQVLGWSSHFTLEDALRDAWRWQCALLNGHR